MIVNDLKTLRCSILPDQAELPLIVNPDAVLSNPGSFECFQSSPALRPGSGVGGADDLIC
jgi:hypothetical protein